jgi:hypothetical protein
MESVPAREFEPGECMFQKSQNIVAEQKMRQYDIGLEPSDGRPPEKLFEINVLYKT